MRTYFLQFLAGCKNTNDAANKISKGSQYTEMKAWVLASSAPLNAYPGVTWAERFAFIENNLTDRPVCKCCDNKVKYNKVGGCYSTYCSNACTSAGGYEKRVRSLRARPKTAKQHSLSKREETSLTRYGAKNPMQNATVQDKQRAATAITTGAPFALQTQQSKDKYKQTVTERFGTTNFSGLPEIQEKIKATMVQNHGVEYAFQLPHVKQARFNAGYDRSSVSGISREFFKAVTSHLPPLLQDRIHSADLGGEFGIMVDITTKVGYYYDFVITAPKVVVEFNGDFWHANPSLYGPDDVLYNNLTASDIWGKDLHKHNTIASRGYDIIVVWEGEYKHNKEQTVQRTVELINDICGK